MLNCRKLLQVSSTISLPLPPTPPFSFPKQPGKVTSPFLQHESGVSLGCLHPMVPRGIPRGTKLCNFHRSESICWAKPCLCGEAGMAWHGTQAPSCRHTRLFSSLSGLANPPGKAAAGDRASGASWPCCCSCLNDFVQFKPAFLPCLHLSSPFSCLLQVLLWCRVLAAGR